MLKFLNEAEVASEFSRLKGVKKIAVAFWGEGALGALGLNNPKPEDAKIICNLESGAVNPSVISELLKLKVEVKTNPRLHSKVYLTNDAVILGSSNASGNGLSLEGSELTSWIEANILIDDKSFITEVDRWFSMQWKAAVAVTPDDIQVAEKMWKKRRQSRSDSGGTNGLFASLENLRDRNIYVALYREHASVEAREVFKEIRDATKKETKNADSKLSFFENWEDLPLDASIISIYVGAKGKIEIDGAIFRRIPELDAKGEDSSVQVVVKGKTILGYPFNKEVRDELRKKLDKEIQDFKASNDEDRCTGLFEALSI